MVIHIGVKLYKRKRPKCLTIWRAKLQFDSINTFIDLFLNIFIDYRSLI